MKKNFFITVVKIIGYICTAILSGVGANSIL